MNWFVRCTRLALAVLVATFGLAVGGASSAFAGEINYGKVGDPIHLVVGYQPYYTESWSGVVMQPMKFYEKYLPKGSTVEFSIGLQGAVIVNAMLAGKQDIGTWETCRPSSRQPNRMSRIFVLLRQQAWASINAISFLQGRTPLILPISKMPSNG